MVEIAWTDQAIADIQSIAGFISRNSEKYAGIQTERFFERVNILETLPLSGRVVPEANDKAIRELIEGNYRIIYFIVNKKRIDILTIHNGYMLLKNSPAFTK